MTSKHFNMTLNLVKMKDLQIKSSSDRETGSTIKFGQWPAQALATVELRDHKLHI